MLNDMQRVLVENNMRLVTFVMKKHFAHQIPLGEWEDFQSIGHIALCKAAETYDSERGAFSTHACNVVSNAFRVEFRNRRASRHIPSCAVISCDEELAEGFRLLDTLVDNRQDIEEEVTLRLMIEGLTDQEKGLLQLRYDGYSQADIGRIMGVSQTQVCHLLKRLRQKLVSG